MIRMHVCDRLLSPSMIDSERAATNAFNNQQSSWKIKNYSYYNKNNKYKEKLVILQSIGIVVIKNKETKVITYTCTYSSGNLIPP